VSVSEQAGHMMAQSPTPPPGGDQAGITPPPAPGTAVLDEFSLPPSLGAVERALPERPSTDSHPCLSNNLQPACSESHISGTSDERSSTEADLSAPAPSPTTTCSTLPIISTSLFTVDTCSASPALNMAPPQQTLRDVPLMALLNIIERSEVSSLDLRPFAIYLCSGKPHEESVAQQLLPHGIDTVCVDNYDSQYSDPVEKTELLASVRVTGALCALAAHPRCLGVICTPPCRTFSAATLAGGDGPEPYRDILRRYGIPRVWNLLPTRVVSDNAVVHSCIAISLAAHSHGGFFLFENPAGHGEGSERPIPGREAHCSLWDFPPIVTFTQETGASLVTFDQCALGRKAKKSTTLLASNNVAPSVERLFGHLQCPSWHNHADTTLLGRLADGSFRTTPAEAFLPEMNSLIVEVVLELAHKCHATPDPEVPSLTEPLQSEPGVTDVASTVAAAQADTAFLACTFARPHDSSAPCRCAQLIWCPQHDLPLAITSDVRLGQRSNDVFTAGPFEGLNVELFRNDQGHTLVM
jgi:hypothetical protein